MNTRPDRGFPATNSALSVLLVGGLTLASVVLAVAQSAQVLAA